MSRPDPSTLNQLAQNLQRESEVETQNYFRQTQLKKTRRAIEAGYDLCMRDHRLGQYAESK